MMNWEIPEASDTADAPRQSEESRRHLWKAPEVHVLTAGSAEAGGPGPGRGGGGGKSGSHADGAGFS